MKTLRDRARILRKNVTPQEVKLWSQLQFMNRDGHHFRRQAPVDGYILDFAEFAHRLIIEIDGSQHSSGSQQTRDTHRDAHFTDAGFRVLRFWNIDIDTAMDGVILKILEALGQTPTRLATARHPPRKGEG